MLHRNISILIIFCALFVVIFLSLCRMDKISSCCGSLKMMHNQCAVGYYKKRYPDATSPFTNEIWQQTNIELFCFTCRRNCLFCGKTHYFKNNKALTVQCNAKCTHWSYYIPVHKHNKGGCNGDHHKFTVDTVTCLDCEDITEKQR